MTLHGTTFLYYALGAVLLVSLFTWWDPPTAIGVATGVIFVLAGMILIYKLLQERKRLEREFTE